MVHRAACVSTQFLYRLSAIGRFCRAVGVQASADLGYVKILAGDEGGTPATNACPSLTHSGYENA